jgi:hypothetical protein
MLRHILATFYKNKWQKVKTFFLYQMNSGWAFMLKRIRADHLPIAGCTNKYVTNEGIVMSQKCLWF